MSVYTAVPRDPDRSLDPPDEVQPTLDTCASCEMECDEVKVVDTDDEYSGKSLCEYCLSTYYDYDDICEVYRVKEEK